MRQRKDPSNDNKHSNPEPKKDNDKDLVIYKNLIEGLKPYATKDDLEPLEIIMQFACIGSGRDPDASEACICGKKNIVRLNYIRNIKKEDPIESATSTIIVGSECINTFHEAKKLTRDFWKGKKAIESDFVRWSQNGVAGHFKTKRKAGKAGKLELWTISFASSKLSTDD